MKRLASTEIPSVRYISYKGLDIAKKPSQYFNSYSLFTGLVKYNDTFYTMKKIPLDESINPNDLPEVQIINSNSQCPFIISYLDYILEQTETSEGAWVNKALYILMENSDYDLRTYLIKYGALDENGLCDLTECLIGANYYLQKELNMAHGDVRPQNVRIIMKNVPGENRKELVFKLSYLDDVLNVNSCGVNKVDTMAYMAPELLCSSVVNSNYETNEPSYQPGQDLLKLITECPDEIRYDPFRADLFSVGLTIFSATTGILFSFKLPAQSFEVKRNGPNEENIICQNLRLIKAKYQNDGYNEILRILLNPNPILRYDFEEIVLRLNKVGLRLNYSECVIETGDSKVKKELDATREAIYELQKIIGDMEKREIEYKDKIETLSNQLRKHTATPGNDVKTANEQGLMNNILGELSSIYDDQTNFMNSISSIKLLTNFEFPDKTQTPGGPVGLVEQVEEKSTMTSKGTYFVKKSSMNADYTKKPSEERALQKEKKVNHGLITHQEFKESIIRRRDHI